MHNPTTTTTLNAAAAIVAKAEGTNPNVQPDRRIVGAVTAQLDRLARNRQLVPGNLTHGQAEHLAEVYDGAGYQSGDREAALAGSSL